MSQDDIARELGLGSTTIGRVERGLQKLSPESFGLFCEKAEVQPGLLLSGGPAWDDAFLGVRLSAPKHIGTDVAAVAAGVVTPPAASEPAEEPLIDLWAMSAEDRALRLGEALRLLDELAEQERRDNLAALSHDCGGLDKGLKRP